MRPEPAPYRIARMSRDDLARTLNWAAAEGWNAGRHDLDAFHAADPGGYFMGWRGTQPVAAISAVRYGDGSGFVGLYIVAPECRGQGLGWALWQHAMASLRGRIAGLDGVVEQQANYRKSGFVLAHRNMRHAGRAPAPRTTFLRAWLAQPDSHSLGIVEDGEVGASGSIRACRAGHKIGPLHADSEAAADALFPRALRPRPGWRRGVPRPAGTQRRGTRAGRAPRPATGVRNGADVRRRRARAAATADLRNH